MDAISNVLSANENVVLCLNGVTSTTIIVENVTHQIPQCKNDNFAINFNMAKDLFAGVLSKKYKRHFGWDVESVLYQKFTTEYSVLLNEIMPNASVPMVYNNSFSSCFYQRPIYEQKWTFIEDETVMQHMEEFTAVKDFVRIRLKIFALLNKKSGRDSRLFENKNGQELQNIQP